MKQKFIQLGECCEIVSGSTPDTFVKDYWDGEIYWATPKDLGELNSAYLSTTQRKITKAGFDSCSTTILPVGSVLFSSRAPIGLVAINTVPMCTNQGFKNLVPKSDLVFNKYLYYWLKFNRKRLEALGNGATFKEISKSVISKVEIPLPPLHEQRRIAAILDKAEVLREKRRQTINKLDSLLQAVFLEMFGDPATNPKGWRRGVLGDVIYSAKDGPHVSPKYSASGIPFLSTRHIKPGRIIWEDLRYISSEEAQAHWKKCKPEMGDILYTKGGTTGMAKAIDFDLDIAVWVHIAVLKTNREIADPLWLEQMLNTSYCYAQSQEFTHGIANHDLGLTRMIKIRLYIPPIELQQRYSDFALRLKKLEEKQNQSLQRLDSLFQSIQQRAFGSKLSIEKPLAGAQQELFSDLTAGEARTVRTHLSLNDSANEQ